MTVRTVSPMTLLHLTFVGSGRQPATMEFGAHLTVVYGASETGKSYIVDAIDYMFGAKELKEIQEAAGYTDILLGLRLAEGRAITLVRQIGANKVLVYDGELHQASTAPPAKILSIRHDHRSEDNLSRYLLKIIGADGRSILRNARGQHKSLSFRDLVHLCIVSETRMADVRSPVLTSGQKTSETAEKSAFRYMLTGQDASGMKAGASEVEVKVGKGKIELLDRLIDDNRASLRLGADEAELTRRLEQLERETAANTEAVDALLSDRSRHAETARALLVQTDDNRRAAGEVSTLLARFDLLRQQYDSDLARLEMVAEAGSLLGYFRTGDCVFCGAAPEHQQPGHHAAETTQLHAAVAAETRKTTSLRDDLLTTMEDLTGTLGELDDEHQRMRERDRAAKKAVALLQDRLAPLRTDTGQLLAVRSQIQADLGVFAQIERLQDLKIELSGTPTGPAAQPDKIPSGSLAEFERLVKQILESWKVPGDNTVSYNERKGEVSVGGRARHSRGKGMRSIIHAAFSTALARYTLQQNLPHPGFVVLDSPVLTYREPHETDIKLTHDVVEHFYAELLDDSPVQVIVVENGDPPAAMGPGGTKHAFGTAGSDRAGFFPP